RVGRMGPHEDRRGAGATDAQRGERLADGVGTLLQGPAEPPGGVAVGLQPRGLPDRPRLEVWTGGRRRSPALADGQLSALEQRVELRERRVESQRCVPDRKHVAGPERDVWPERAVPRIGNRGQRVQAVVSAGKLDDHQDAARVGTQRRERKRERGESGGTRLQKLASCQGHGRQLSWYSGLDSTRWRSPRSFPSTNRRSKANGAGFAFGSSGTSR